MTSVVEFEVLGLPSPQGSKKHVGNGRMVESSKTLATWRDSLTNAARDVAPDVPIDEPIRLTVEFRCPMPRSRSKAVRAAGRGPKTTAPDLDKLVRAVGDALEAGGLIRSDALICELHASKVEVVGWTGAVIRLEMP
jgi:crossover junction endodeoxyribonuclease RusA